MSQPQKKRKSNLLKKWFDKKSTKTTECDSNNIPKCASIHRIGIILSYYHKWLKLCKKDKLNCGMYEFLHSGTKATKSKKANCKNTSNNNNNFNYSSIKLLDDYHHILYDHDNENELEAIYDYLLSKYLSSTICKTKTCKILIRNNRDRWFCSMNNAKRIEHYQGTDNNQHVYISQLCDRIHCALLHSFDCGYKLNKKDINLIQTQTRKHTFSRNQKLKYILDVIIKPKRKKIRKIRGSQRYKNNKFISFYELNDEKKETDSDSESESESEGKTDEKKQEDTKYIEYSFGYPFTYWSAPQNEWYITAKYKDLRREIVNNETHKISLNQFHDCLKNAIDLVNCKKGKKLRCKYRNLQFEEIGIEVGSTIHIDHILAILFITNYDNLYSKFLATFKKANEFESNSDLIARHWEFHHLAKLLFELIHLYGQNDTDMDSDNGVICYHGFDQQQIFQDTFIRFDMLTSTTLNLNVALNYSNGMGLMLALYNYKSDGMYFDCRWLSDFSAEYENIFVQNEFKFKSILNMTLYHDYEWYLHVLNVLKLMFNGMCTNDNILNEKMYVFLHKLFNEKITQNIDKSDTEEAIFGTGFVSNEAEEKEVVDNENEDEIPLYVVELFKKYCNDKYRLILNIWSLNIFNFKMFNDADNVYYGYKLIRNLFIDDKYKEEIEWIYFKKLTDLYRNTELICVYNVDWINGNNLPSITLNDNFANQLLSFLSLDSSLLMNIWIYLPNEKEIEMQLFIDKYASQFSYIKWKASLQNKQIPGLNEKLGLIKTLCVTYEGQKEKDDEQQDVNDEEEDDDDDDDESDSY